MDSLRIAHANPGGMMPDTEAVYSAMQRDAINGISLALAVGGGDPRGIGETSLGILRSFDLIQENTRVLDLGCGCGRLAVPMTQVLGPKTRYMGTDIIPEMISFCRREISTRWPNFEFYCVPESNPAYAPMVAQGSHLKGLMLEDPGSLDGQFDLVIASSVFTHLDEVAARTMFQRLRAWLAPGGSALVTCFLLNHWSRTSIRERKAEIFVNSDADHAKVLNINNNTAVAFDEALFETMACNAGFPGLYSINHGTWTGAAGAHMQDFVVLKKDLPVPPLFDPQRYLALNPDVAKAGMDPTKHWFIYGKKEGRPWH